MTPENAKETMRRFEDENGRSWLASVRERPGPDYKGRYHLHMVEVGEEGAPGLDLLDIRWNTERTAARTLETMSEVELRRRLRQARGRHRSVQDGPAPEPAALGPAEPAGDGS